MNVLLLSPQKDLIEEIVPYLKRAARDYSSNLVVFPGKRPSHFLRKALAREMKGSFVPPVICSMDEFIDRISEEKLPGRKLESIDAVSLLYEIHRKALNPLGGGSFMTPDSFFPVGLKIYRDIEELSMEGIDFHSVKAVGTYTAETIPELTLKRLQSLAFFYEEFFKTVAERGFSTRSLRYRAAADLIDDHGTGMFQQMIFAGFFALTHYEKVLFRKLLLMEKVLFLFQDGRGQQEKLAELGISVTVERNSENGPDLHFYRSPDMHGQVYVLRTLIEKKGGENALPPDNTAIVLPSPETLFPLLRQGISEMAEDSYNISLGYPLQRTPLFAFLNNIMELLTSMDGDRLYVPDYLNFVLHPYTKNIYCNESAEITRILFHSLEEKLAESRTRRFISFAEIEEDKKFFVRVSERMPENMREITGEFLAAHLRSIHRNTIGKFLAFENVADFTVKCTELLTYIFNNSTARLHPLFFPFSESFIRSLEGISRSLMKDISFAERSGYFTFFRKYLSSCYTPFEGMPLKGLQVLGFLETRNLRFDKVFILDVNEDVLPDTKKEDTLLPFKARQMLGLPTYQDRDALAAYYFDTLIQGAREVHLFSVESDKKERSRFVERLLWEKQKREKIIDTKSYFQTVQYRIGLSNSVPPHIMKTGSMTRFLREFTYSASALDAYLRCQLQFYYSYILRVDKKEAMSGDIGRADIGKFVHQVLSEYFSKRKGHPLKPKDIDIKDLKFLIDGLFDKEYGKGPAGAVYLLKKQITVHLRDFFQKYFIPLIKDETVTVLNCEEEIRHTMKSFKLRGRVDAIIRRGEKTVIIDYKSGSNANYLKINFEKLDIKDRESWSAAVGSIQLPFYLMLYLEENKESIKNVNGMFLLLGRSLINREIELPLFTNDDREGKYTQIIELLFRLLEEINDPDTPFSPSTDRKKTCPDCSYQYICGTQWIVK